MAAHFIDDVDSHLSDSLETLYDDIRIMNARMEAIQKVLDTKKKLHAPSTTD